MRWPYSEVFLPRRSKSHSLRWDSEPEAGLAAAEPERRGVEHLVIKSQAVEPLEWKNPKPQVPQARITGVKSPILQKGVI